MTIARQISALLVVAVLASCAEEAPPLQPAPPKDRNFTATVNGQPVVGGTGAFECVINASNDAQQQQYLLTFSDDLGHTIQVGIERGDTNAGERRVLYGMATGAGRAYGRVREPSAVLTWVEPTATGMLVSGRFSVKFDLVNVVAGVDDRKPLEIANALFEQVECIDPDEARQALGG